jgi:hypothetical protein
MPSKLKTIYITESRLKQYPRCFMIKLGKRIFNLAQYEKSKLKIFTTFCEWCLFNTIGDVIRIILKQSPLVFLSYKKNPDIPKFLKRI